MTQERRARARLVIDTKLDDLQSELEAEARAANELHHDVCAADSLSGEQFKHADLTGTLLRRIAELRMSVRAQQSTLADLRQEMTRLRASRKR